MFGKNIYVGWDSREDIAYPSVGTSHLPVYIQRVYECCLKTTRIKRKEHPILEM